MIRLECCISSTSDRVRVQVYFDDDLFIKCWTTPKKIFSSYEIRRFVDSIHRYNRALELLESAEQVVRKLQKEREGLIDRVTRALRGITEGIDSNEA